MSCLSQGHPFCISEQPVQIAKLKLIIPFLGENFSSSSDIPTALNTEISIYQFLSIPGTNKKGKKPQKPYVHIPCQYFFNIQLTLIVCD